MKLSRKILLFFSIIYIISHFAFSFTVQAAQSAEKIIAQAKNSVVRIGVKWTGKVTAPNPIFNSRTSQFEAGEKILEDDVETAVLGSGFVVFPSGYIVTNAHVVDVSTETAATYIWEEYSNNLYERLKSSLTDTDTETLNAIYQALLDFVSKNGKIDNLEYTISIFNPEQKEGTIENFISKGFLADIRKMGEPFPRIGKDVAVLKIQKENLPALTLGDSKTVKEGQKIYVLGYPTVADLNESGVTDPTITSGIVSAIKQSSQGNYNVIQIDAAISGGNSGGPVLNENGAVIGIATFKARDEQGYNWILPIELAKEYLNELNVKYANPQSQSWKEKLESLPIRLLIIATGILLVIFSTLLSVLLFLKKKKGPADENLISEGVEVPPPSPS